MSKAKASILIVDDEEPIRRILSRKLEAEGYTCVTAGDGSEALWKASKEDFSAMLLDIKMPGQSGLEVLTQMNIDHPDTAVIMITAIAESGTAIEAMKSGAYDYVMKPFNMHDVIEKLQEALERRESVLQNRSYQQCLEERVEQQEGQIGQVHREAVEALVREQLALEKAYGMAGSERKVESDSTFVQLAKALALVTEMREPYLRGHAEQVRSLATQIAVSLGCPDQFVQNIGFAALIHDIGKVVIPERILFKKGRLSRTEYAEVKRYPMVSVDILRDVEYFKDITPIVESQQEWYDGSGYPNKLKGKAIPLGARILAVADAYDAMTSIRPYRPSMNQEEATSRLREGAGTQWDPLVVDALLRMLDRQQDDMQGHPVTT